MKLLTLILCAFVLFVAIDFFTARHKQAPTTIISRSANPGRSIFYAKYQSGHVSARKPGHHIIAVQDPEGYYYRIRVPSGDFYNCPAGHEAMLLWREGPLTGIVWKRSVVCPGNPVEHYPPGIP